MLTILLTICEAVPELDQTLNALSDPTRRQIVNMLAEKSLSAGEIGKTFEISAPALSRHLRILRRSGLVDDETINRVLHDADTPQDACSNLITHAKEAGGHDNVSVIIAVFR